MRIELWDIARIKPYDRNPRRNDHAVPAVARSIAEFGFRQPLVVDEQDVLIVGETRLKAARHLGLKQVPVHMAQGLTPAQVKAYRVADNKTAELADWDQAKLVQELADLQHMHFDLDLMGFAAEELRELLQTDPPIGQTDPDDVPEPPDEPITQPGDLWLLGNHRLLCGDSSKADDVDRLLGGAAIHLVNSDPPYGVKVEPRSNNAIAAGLSSFQGTTHHQALDLERHPVELATRAIQYSSQPGEHVLDLFGGSGSTLIAAEQTGRKAFLMELDGLYCDVIVQRWQAFTGKQAERVSAETA